MKEDNAQPLPEEVLKTDAGQAPAKKPKFVKTEKTPVEPFDPEALIEV